MESGNEVIANIDNNCIDSEDISELRGIHYINKLCKKTSQKLNALTRISNYMTFDKRKIYLKAFITSPLRCVKSVQIRSYFWSEYRKIRTRNNSVFGHFSRSVQFSYCSFVWFFYSKSLGKKINALHERVLRITYGDITSLFNEL